MTRCRAVTLAAVLAAAAGSASAQQNVVKPEFMVMVDTSGSMIINSTGTNTCGYTTQYGFIPAGQGDRLSAAKCVLTRIVNGTGDAIWGLGRFTQTCSGGGGCTISSFVCDSTSGSGEILEGIGEDNEANILRWVNNDTPIQCSRTCATPELGSGNGFGTPITGSLKKIKDYYLGNAGFTSPIASDRAGTPRVDGCRPYRAVLLTDGGELCGATPPPGADAPGAACELRRVCVGGSQNGAVTCNANGAVTGGSCNGVTTSTGGTFYEVKTYVIGFGISNGDAAIEAMARAGGTPGDGPGGADEGFYATNEQTLSAAFSRIIAGSLLVEVCNNADDNCNSVIDEGFTKYCDRDGRLGVVVNSETLCTPVPDDCDGMDDNCEAGTSDEPRNACGTCGPAPTEICDNIDNDCDGFIDEGGVCGSCIPSPEICDGRDNDCDGRIDELVTRSCGSAIPPCTVGMQTCVEQTVQQMMGTWGACSGTTGSMEICDGMDNDCDGIVDGNVRACGTDVGECVAGTEECIAGTFRNCTAIGPQNEVCDGFDNNCNNMIDENDPGSGGSCTAPAICGQGTLHCRMGMLVCEGSAMSMPEICNGLDDDCNGMIDDGIADRGPCGSPLGGACQPGRDRCTMGRFQCIGYVGPTPETCNCIDDNCDGMTDNPPAGTSLCPAGSQCTDCQCALPCGPGEFPCPAGKRCRNGFCVADPCAGVQCPAGADGTRMQCSMGVCVTSCSLQSCAAPLVCRPTDAVCVPDNCHYFPSRCTAGQICLAGQCVADPCAGVSCSGGQFCRGGTCVASCAGVTCAGASVCRDGACAATGCPNLCTAGRVCDPARMMCVTDPCTNVLCNLGEVCSAPSGMCVPDPCTGVTCPGDQVCRGGNCFDKAMAAPDGGVAQPTKILVTGDGGCACRTSGRKGHDQPALALLFASLIAIVLARRKRPRH